MHIQHPVRTTIVGVSTVAIAAAVGLTVIAADDEPAPPPTTVVVAERAPAATPTTAARPAYLIIQDEIDRALAERDSVD